MAKAKEKPGTAVASIQERIAQRIANLDKTTPSAGSKRISLKGSKFRLPSGVSSDGPLNCIILACTNANSYYIEDYAEGTSTPPDCFATAIQLQDMVPNPSIENPQHTDCPSCPHNKFGSKGRGKACDNMVNLAVIPEDFKDDSDVLIVSVKAKGLSAWGGYVRKLAAEGLDPINVVTSLAFQAGLSYPCLTFKALKPIQVNTVSQFVSTAEAALT